jgi:hypothetical protein
MQLRNFTEASSCFYYFYVTTMILCKKTQRRRHETKLLWDDVGGRGVCNWELRGSLRDGGSEIGEVLGVPRSSYA